MSWHSLVTLRCYVTSVYRPLHVPASILESFILPEVTFSYLRSQKAVPCCLINNIHAETRTRLYFCRNSCVHSWFPWRPAVFYISYIFITLQFYHIRSTKNITPERHFMRKKKRFTYYTRIFNWRSSFRFYIHIKIYRLHSLGLVT